MFLFTNFNLSDILRYYTGYTCVGMIALMLVVNVSFLVKSGINSVILKNKRRVAVTAGTHLLLKKLKKLKVERDEKSKSDLVFQ